MRPVYLLAAGLFFALCLSAQADFDLAGIIPAPDAPYGESEVTGLTPAGSNLVVAVKTDTSSFLFLVRPEDGLVLREAEYADEIPCCRGHRPRFMSVSTVDAAADRYLVGDECGAILEVVFSDTSSSIVGAYHLDDVETPTGLVAVGDTVYVIDWDDETLIKAVGTAVVAEYDLTGLDSPSALARYRGNLLVASLVDDSYIREITACAAPVDTHFVDGLTGCFPGAAAFTDGALYLAGDCSGILVFESSDEGIWVPPGDDIPVEVVPGELAVSFDSVSTPGWLYVTVSDSQVCPAPADVELFPPFYDLSTTAHFDYVATVELTFTDSLLPVGYDVDRLRIFKRPSGVCQDYRDITVDWVEILPALRTMMRTQSEDDEFSVFALGLDSRRPRALVEYKFGDVDAILYSNADVIPPDVFSQITALLDDARAAYYRGRTSEAEALVRSIPAIVRATPAIPHTFDGTPGSNVGGGIISRCNTLAFSLMYSESEALTTEAVVLPETIIVGLLGAWVTAYAEVPEGLAALDVDPLCIYMEGRVQALPDSVTAGDYDDDGALEIRAVFPQGEVGQLFEAGGPATVRLSAFIDGYELMADAGVDVSIPTVSIMDEDVVEGGRTYRITWTPVLEETGVLYTLTYSIDGGRTWDEIAAGLSHPFFDWTVPEVEAEAAVIRVEALRAGVPVLVTESDTFAIMRAAGIPGWPGEAPGGIRISPNPSGVSFTIDLHGMQKQPTDLKVYSVRGEHVMTLLDGVEVDGGRSLVWHSEDHEGARVAPGAYFIVLTTGGRTSVRKVIVQR
jgi:hypothetical protein